MQPYRDGDSARDSVTARLWPLFEAMDTDGDGKVNRREMIKALRSSPELQDALDAPLEKLSRSRKSKSGKKNKKNKKKDSNYRFRCEQIHRGALFNGQVGEDLSCLTLLPKYLQVGLHQDLKVTMKLV